MADPDGPLTCEWCGDQFERRLRGPWQRVQRFCPKPKTCSAQAWRAAWRAKNGVPYDTAYGRDRRVPAEMGDCK